MKLVSLQALVGVALGGYPDDGTDVISYLNDLIAQSNGDVYTGGTGVIVRAPDFITGGDGKVVPGTFWHNDIQAPSQFYPTQGNPWFPNNNWDGFGDISYQSTDLVDWNTHQTIGPWKFASVGAVVGSSMNQLYPNEFDKIQDYNWGWGVFYAKDSNAVDQRCEWLDSFQGWDCPGGWIPLSGGWQADGWGTGVHGGAGVYPPGNPTVLGEGNSGGGAGCHFGGSSDLDQPDTKSDPNLVGDYHCQCNYDLSGNDWADWFWQMVNNLKQKPNYSGRWWLGGGGGAAPSWAMDATICWVNNPRDLIKMQNQLYWNKETWNNQMVPSTDWSTGDLDEIRKYWGWNEIPVDRYVVEDPLNWDAVMIKLPAAICGWDASGTTAGSGDSVSCLGAQELAALESDLDNFVNGGKLNPGIGNIGNRPGSYVVIAREWGATYDSSTSEARLGSSWNGIAWKRWFFCESITIGKYDVVHQKPSDDPNGNGACYIEYSGAPAPTPVPPSPPAGVMNGAVVHQGSNKCLGTSGNSYSAGSSVVFVDCYQDDTQGWNFETDAQGWSTLQMESHGICVDSGGVWKGASLQLWDCNGTPQQKFGYDSGSSTIYSATSSDASLCLDVQNGGAYSENVAWLWDCNGLDNQKFQWHHFLDESEMIV